MWKGSPWALIVLWIARVYVYGTEKETIISTFLFERSARFLNRKHPGTPNRGVLRCAIWNEFVRL